MEALFLQVVGYLNSYGMSHCHEIKLKVDSDTISQATVSVMWIPGLSFLRPTHWLLSPATTGLATNDIKLATIYFDSGISARNIDSSWSR